MGKMHLALLLLCLAVALPASAKDVFRCTSQSGAVEYRDSPCIAGAGGKVELQNASVSETDQAAAETALRKVNEQSKAIDERTNARTNAARDARAAEVREAEARRLAELYAPPPWLEPQVLLVPVYVDPCFARPSRCASRQPGHRGRIQAALPAPVAQKKRWAAPDRR